MGDAFTTPDLPTNRGGHMIAPHDRIVYRLTFNDRTKVTTAQERAGLEMLWRHGIGAPADDDKPERHAFLDGCGLTVFRHDDGSLWMLAWRAAGNDAVNAPLCPTCPACLRTEQILVPATGPFPLIPDATAYSADQSRALWIDSADFTGLPAEVVLVDG